ncbi:hypothetical protein [uncultured Parasutterella sp.]|uniref:hypothetical protein n=1 Tax=uncultured Parasutterella sp. TaxID=1263098 RepID=UPI0025940662|nr:hypothetical protein [uncultured Parasutterella sp.]
MKKTSLITYNLHERGRQYRGQDRSKIDFSRIIDFINGPECQEMVKNRDLLGYYGHYARMKYGLSPTEVGAVRGEAPVTLQPAIVTTKIKAYKDGTIEHQAEFLNTDNGKICEKLYDSRVGGFSSAISGDKSRFFGFDYVLEPNYSTNRGYMFDSVSVSKMTDEEFFDAVHNEQAQALLAIIDQQELGLKVANEAIENLRTENNQLMSMLSNAGVNPSGVFDSASELPIITSGGAAQKILDDVRNFRAAKTLPRFASGKSDKPAEPKRDPITSFILNRKI